MRQSPPALTVPKAPPGAGLGIREASEKLGVHPRTLMGYERIGLVKPARRSNRREYSADELRWLGCVQEINREGGVSLHGLSTLLRFVPCWAIRAQVTERESGGCCPSSYPAGTCLDRVVHAYAGEAPAGCQDCGVYEANREASLSALENAPVVPTDRKGEDRE